MLGVMRFIYYFGPHDSGHHPTPVDSFHPRRLAPSESQTIIRLGDEPCRVA